MKKYIEHKTAEKFRKRQREDEAFKKLIEEGKGRARKAKWATVNALSS